MLTKPQLRTAALLLRQASASTQWAHALFSGEGDFVRAARLNNLFNLLSDEAKQIEDLIPGAPNNVRP